MDSSPVLHNNNVPYIERDTKSRDVRCLTVTSFALGVILLLSVALTIISKFAPIGTIGLIVGGSTAGAAALLLAVSLRYLHQKSKRKEAQAEQGTGNEANAIGGSRTVKSSSNSPTKYPLTEESLVFGSKAMRLKNECIQAVKKLNKLPSPFQKIFICCSHGTLSDLYFSFGDGEFYATGADFKPYPDGSVLIIRIALEQQASDRICSRHFFNSVLHAAENEALIEFVNRKHQHISMSFKEYNYLCQRKQFPDRVKKILSGKTVLPPLSEQNKVSS